MSTLDLNNPPPKHKFSVSMEKEEATSELGVRLFKEVVLFLVAIALVLVVVWLCYNSLIDPKISPDEKKWAMSVLSGATGGLIGYLVRK